MAIEGHGPALQITVDGQAHALSAAVGPPWQSVRFEQPGPLGREYQVDGSDTTSTSDRNPASIAALLDLPIYGVDSWLRDESSYSRWERMRVVDLATGEAVPGDSKLPDDFRIEASLRRPEAAARLWLVGSTTDRREGLELNRDTRNARWIIQRGAGVQVEFLPRWFFPEQPAPFAAELLHLLGRSAAAAFGLALAAVLLSRALALVPQTNAPPVRHGRTVLEAVLALWLLAASLVTAWTFHQMPHILDAVGYHFQASLFAVGKLSLDAPPLAAAFRGPFEVLWEGRFFAQYPPGAPVAYALGHVVGLEWLVGPLGCLALIATTSLTASMLHGKFVGLVVLGLGVLSPFVLFQAGSFLSHPIAGGLLAGALAAFAAGERDGRQRWFALSGMLLGWGFLTREAATALFALPLAVRLLSTRRWRAIMSLVACGLPFLLVYLLYNRVQTGSAFLLPRSIFDASDHFGFGSGIGFHTRHTVAAGLANTDELLTSLQFELTGWPPLFALGLLGVPFLFGRARTWDWLAASGLLAFIVAYAAYFYHGIALGPRYYFEAMPWLLLLAGRGARVLAVLARSRLAGGLVLALLSLNTVLFYLPAELQRRTDFSAMTADRRVRLDFVQPSITGPRLVGLPEPALVLTDDWWLFNAALVTLNCPQLPNCAVLFALATTPEDSAAVRAEYAGRASFRTVDDGGTIRLAALP